MRVEQFLSEGALRFGSRPAVVAHNRPHSYADLARSSDRIASALMGRGIKRGDRVALFMGNSFEAIVSAFAVLKAGAVVSPIDPASDADALAHALNQTRAVGIITEARHASAAAIAMTRAFGVRLVLLCGGDRSTASNSCLCYEDLVGGIGSGPGVARAGVGNDAAILLPPSFASGAATLTHADLIAATAERPEAASFSSILSYAGICQLLVTIREGATLILEARSVFRRTILDRIDGEAEMATALNG
jgi:acyl-CoA synthetase (AMP-forming)/AMP-acid ligase II